MSTDETRSSPPVSRYGGISVKEAAANLRRNLPYVRRFGRSQAEYGHVTVELTLDTSDSTDAMSRARHGILETIRREQYQQRLNHERLLAQSYLGTLLDDLCRDFGLNPVTVWRLPGSPGYLEWLARLDRDIKSWNRQMGALRAAMHYSLSEPPDLSKITGGSGA